MGDNIRKIRVTVIDDHTITRDGIKTILKIYDDFDLVGEASNGLEAIDLCKELEPDIVLMDLEMPVLDGVSAINEIKKEHPGIKIIALTSFAGKKLVKDAIKAGAASYIVKNISPDDLAETIRKTYKGEAFFSPEATAAMVEEIKDPSAKYNLTGQELNILGLIVKGYSNKKIANELYISSNTVKFHVGNILSKLGASTRAEAAALAAKEELIK